MRIVLLAIASCLVCHLASAQTELQRIWQDDTGGTAYEIAESEGWVYVSNNTGVSIYDVRDPEQPQLAAAVDTGGAIGICLEGSKLYVAGMRDGLEIFDVRDPVNPEQIGVYRGNYSGVFVHDGIAYLRIIAGAHAEIVDVTDPAHPVELERLDPMRGAAAAGSHLWFGTPGRGVVHLDVSDPDSPIEVGTVPGTSGVMSLELRGSFLYVAMYSSGTRVFDVSNPPEPRLIFSTPETGESWHVSGRYPIACVADLQEGVEVLDLSRPAGESLLIRESTLAPHTLYYTNNYVHVADQDEGYVLLQLDHHPAPRQPTGRLVPVGATTGAS